MSMATIVSPSSQSSAPATAYFTDQKKGEVNELKQVIDLILYYKFKISIF